MDILTEELKKEQVELEEQVISLRKGLRESWTQLRYVEHRIYLVKGLKSRLRRKGGNDEEHNSYGHCRVR